jgi:peptidoglycan/LPS O-acetylase OafA/YrhL
MDEQTSQNEPAIEPATGRVAVIDILRGLAILWVMSFHLWIDETGGALVLSTVYGQFFDQVQAGAVYGSIASAFEVFLGAGYQGVQIFMMLSGMSLVMLAYRRGEPPALAGYAARFRKIVPAYWAGILIFFCVYTLIAVLQVWRDGDGFHDGWWTITLMHGVPFRYELADLPWALTVFGPLFRSEPTGLVGALWFVPLLLQYYLLFPLLLPILRRVGPWQFALIGAAVMILARTLLLQWGDLFIDPFYFRRTLDWFAPFRIAEFMFGMSLGYLFVHYRAKVNEWVSSPLDVVGLLVLAVLCQWLALGVTWDNTFVRSISVVVGYVGLVLLILPLLFKAPGRAEESAPSRALIYLGVISLTALIVNDCMRMVASFLYTGGTSDLFWWFFLTVIYIPVATVLFAYPLARVLGLLPKRARVAAMPETEPASAPLDLQPSPGA